MLSIRHWVWCLRKIQTQSDVFVTSVKFLSSELLFIFVTYFILPFFLRARKSITKKIDKMPMDERELGQRVKALTKCVAANEPAENAIKLLKTLKEDASPTEEMLRVRQIISDGERNTVLALRVYRHIARFAQNA